MWWGAWSDLGPLEYVALAIELPLLAFHVSVTVLVAAKVRRRSVLFVNSFYKLYLIQCASNYAVYFTLLVDRNHIFGGLFPDTIVTRWVLNTAYQLAAYLQLAAFTLIAVNRWTALVHPVRHQQIWKGLWLRLAVTAMALVALILSLIRPVSALIFMRTNAMSANKGFAFAGFVRSWAVASINLSVTFMDAVLEMWSYAAYRKLSFRGKQENIENLRLLVFSILEIIPQLLKVAYYVLNALNMSYFIFFELYTDAADTVITFLISFQALSGPICLLVTSALLRKEYRTFFGCAKMSTPVGPLSIEP